MEKITIMDVTPRDGLQNEKFILTHEEKMTLIQKIADCGFEKIEVGSFVNPKAVPQMAGTAKLVESLPARESAKYYSLILNRKGYDLAFAAGSRNMNYVLSVTETMSRKNTGMSVEESFRQFMEIYQLATANAVTLRMYLAVVFHCPFEGRTPLETARHWIEKMARLKIADICLADTDGKTEPTQMKEVVSMARPLVEGLSDAILSVHLHNTYSRAKENLETALHCGIRHFDSSIGGLGGCPFAPGAKGNVSAEMLVDTAEQMGFVTGIGREKLQETSTWLNQLKTTKSAIVL